MSLPRFFLNNQVLAGQEQEEFILRLDSGDLKHAHVLRLQPGEHIAVVDAAQDYFECEVIYLGEEMTVRIARHDDAVETGAQVVLFQGLCKGDKMDMVIRHATELGVAGFVPLICKRSVMKLDSKKAQSKVGRWQAVAKSAAMQSGQPAIPEVGMPATPQQAAQMMSGATCVIICWEEEHRLSLGQAIRKALDATLTPENDARIAVCIGPEGGFTEQEVQALKACNPRSYSVTLGPSILRTETAGIVAPALVLYELGGLQ